MRDRFWWLSRPWFLAAVGLLFLNDQHLKERWPGFWTGKLSDLVGPVVIATLASVVVGRSVGVIVTVVGFAALKTVPGVAEAVAPFLGGVTRRDASDLVGLVALAPAWWLLGRGIPSRPSAAPRFVRRRVTRDGYGGEMQAPLPLEPRAPASAWNRVLPVAGALAAVFATTATSPYDPPAVDAVIAVDSTLYARVVSSYGDVGRDIASTTNTTSRDESERDPGESPAPGTGVIDDGSSGLSGVYWAQSTDGGRTWSEAEAPSGFVAVDRRTEACRSDGWCFAARGASVEEREPGGEWRRSFALGRDEREVLDYRRYGGGGTEVDELFASVVVVATPNGEWVVVSAGDQGVLTRGPDGGWERRAVLEVDPTDLGGAVWPLRLAEYALFASGPVALVLVGIRSLTKARGAVRKVGSLVGALAIAGGLWALGIAVWAVGTFNASDPLILAAIAVVFALAVLFVPMSFVKLVAGPASSQPRSAF